jgi:exodeoxyribonuclease VII large subunit
MDRRLEALRHRRDLAWNRLHHLSPAHRLASFAQRLANMEGRLRRLPTRLIPLRREHLAGLAHALDALSPLGTLARGYAILRRAPEGEVIRDAAQVAEGDLVEARLGRGSFTARVEGVDGVQAARPRRV